jgi:hypothetical protein
MVVGRASKPSIFKNAAKIYSNTKGSVTPYRKEHLASQRDVEPAGRRCKGSQQSHPCGGIRAQSKGIRTDVRRHLRFPLGMRYVRRTTENCRFHFQSNLSGVEERITAVGCISSASTRQACSSSSGPGSSENGAKFIPSSNWCRQNTSGRSNRGCSIRHSCQNLTIETSGSRLPSRGSTTILNICCC